MGGNSFFGWLSAQCGAAVLGARDISTAGSQVCLWPPYLGPRDTLTAGSQACLWSPYLGPRDTSTAGSQVCLWPPYLGPRDTLTADSQVCLWSPYLSPRHLNSWFTGVLVVSIQFFELQTVLMLHRPVGYSGGQRWYPSPPPIPWRVHQRSDRSPAPPSTAPIPWFGCPCPDQCCEVWPLGKPNKIDLPSYLSHSLADHWGTTVDFTTSFLHSSQFAPFHSMIFHSRPVHSLMLSSRRFLCLPLRLPPWTVPCRIVLASPDDRVTCMYHFSLHLFTKRVCVCVFLYAHVCVCMCACMCECVHAHLRAFPPKQRQLPSSSHHHHLASEHRKRLSPLENKSNQAGSLTNIYTLTPTKFKTD